MKKKTKILLVNKNDISGGAAIASYRLHKGMPTMGVDSKYLVARKQSIDSTVITPYGKISDAVAMVFSKLDQLSLSFYPRKKNTMFSPSIIPTHKHAMINNSGADIIHLHWINEGFIGIEDIAQINKPIVWPLHDMWAFTGGCHYSDGCKRYKSSCGKCPQLCSDKESDFSRWIWNRKKKAY